jgi:hypothetical protein
MTDLCPPRPNTVLVDTLALDDLELGVLSVLRHFLTSFAQPDTQAWTVAFTIATERWGVAEGPRLAQGVLAVLQALMNCRSTGLRFSNPMCEGCRLRATCDEAAFMTMLHCMRRDRTAEARAALAELTFGRMDSTLIQTGLALASRFPAERGGAWQTDARMPSAALH